MLAAYAWNNAPELRSSPVTGNFISCGWTGLTFNQAVHCPVPGRLQQDSFDTMVSGRTGTLTSIMRMTDYLSRWNLYGLPWSPWFPAGCISAIGFLIQGVTSYAKLRDAFWSDGRNLFLYLASEPSSTIVAGSRITCKSTVNHLFDTSNITWFRSTCR